MNIEMKDGRTFSGSSELEIVQQMRARAFGQEDATIADYAAWVATKAKEFENVELTVAGGSDDEVASALISEMKRTGLVVEFEDASAARDVG